eukprot:2015028-Ditylum_brightwellii.AAC.1
MISPVEWQVQVTKQVKTTTFNLGHPSVLRKPTSTLSLSSSTSKDEVSKGDSDGVAEWCYLTPEAVRWFMW